MEKLKFDKNEIVVFNNKIVQYLGEELDNGAIVQDIHTKKDLIHKMLIQRKATKDEIKWFCEKTENINFISPNTKIR